MRELTRAIFRMHHKAIQHIAGAGDHILFAVEFISDRAVGHLGAEIGMPEGFPGARSLVVPATPVRWYGEKLVWRGSGDVTPYKPRAK